LRAFSADQGPAPPAALVPVPEPDALPVPEAEAESGEPPTGSGLAPVWM